MKSINALSIAVTGKSTAYTGTAGGSTIPAAADGNTPKYCWVVSTSACHFRVGKGAQTAVTTDAYLPANWPVIVNTTGCDNYSAVQDSAGGNFNIAPLEWVR